MRIIAQCTQKQKSTPRGFESLRAEPNVFLVEHLSHSVAVSRHLGHVVANLCRIPPQEDGGCAMICFARTEKRRLMRHGRSQTRQVINTSAAHCEFDTWSSRGLYVEALSDFRGLGESSSGGRVSRVADRAPIPIGICFDLLSAGSDVCGSLTILPNDNERRAVEAYGTS